MAKVLTNSTSGFGVKAGPTGKVGNTSGPAKSVGTQKPGGSSQEGSGSGKYAAGGDSKMQPFSGAGVRTPGITSNPGNGKHFSVPAVGQMTHPEWLSKGNDHMQPHRGSQAKKPGTTTSY